MRRSLSVLLAAIILLAAVPTGAQGGGVRVILDGRSLAFDVPPRIERGRVLVPMRAIFEAAGARLTWDPVMRAVEARRGDIELQLAVRATVAFVAGRPVPLDVPAQIRDGRTLVPLRFVAESLGAGVRWDESARTVHITMGAGTPPAPVSGPAPALRLERVLSGLEQPVLVTHAGDGSGRLFIVEQPGRIRIVRDGRLLAEPFLDVTGAVNDGGNEQGLLGLAFHPGYAGNGRLYINYTGSRGATVVARYQVSDRNADRADAASAATVLTVAQPYANHNGGHIAFGPDDGFLYIALGDGGSGGDPQGNGQNTATLLGALLRIDVDRGSTYAIPPDNPLAAGPGRRAEIWAYGLRNPWRFSFDRETGHLYIADVGQRQVEEVNFQTAGTPGGQNYGWNVYEGTGSYTGGTLAGAVFPVAEYSHGADGCSVTGGYVYRGRALPHLAGTYVYGDYCSGRIWGLTRSGGRWHVALLIDTDLNISSFGEDEAGELYVVHHRGDIYRLAAR